MRKEGEKEGEDIIRRHDGREEVRTKAADEEKKDEGLLAGTAATMAAVGRSMKVGRSQ